VVREAATHAGDAVMGLLIAFTAGVLVGITLSDWQFTRSVRRACAAIDEQEGE